MIYAYDIVSYSPLFTTFPVSQQPSNSSISSLNPVMVGGAGGGVGGPVSLQQPPPPAGGGPPPPKEELLLEIRRLRERIKGLESDNASMHTKLSKTQKDVDQRLTEIELQIGPEEDEEEAISSGSVSCSLNSGEEEEKNRESFI